MLSEGQIEKICPAINKFFFSGKHSFPEMHTSINKLQLLLPPYQFNPFTDGRTADYYNRFVTYNRFLQNHDNSATSYFME